MLQKELIKRLKGKYETKMDDKGWLNVFSDGIPLCRVKYNGNCIINDDENLSEEYREKIADIQDEVLTVREYIWSYCRMSIRRNGLRVRLSTPPSRAWQAL